METTERLKNRLTDSRAYELLIIPPPAVFDVEALQATHQYLFQDFKRFGFADPPPGILRYYIPSEDWKKHRELESIRDHSFVCYSPMGEHSLKELEKVLKEAQPDKLKSLPLDKFIEKMSELYAQLDYTHPFHDGNSRTLRMFTRRLARASGYDIEWGRLGGSAKQRDILYIARDRAVGEIALKDIREETNKERVVFSMDKFKSNPSLFQLMTIITCVPIVDLLRITSIEQEKIIAKHPELESTTYYSTMPEMAIKQRLLVMDGQCNVQSEKEGAWTTQKVNKAGLLKHGFYNLYTAEAADKSKQHDGMIVHNDNKRIYQQIGKNSFVMHDKKDFDKVPEIGDTKSISYNAQGKAIVEAAKLTRGRSLKI